MTTVVAKVRVLGVLARAAVLLLASVLGCGQVSKGGQDLAETSGGSSAGQGNQSGAGGTTSAEPVPVTSCAPGGSPEQPVEICGAGERCCACGCGPSDATCAQQLVCSPAAGPSCGTEQCREGYVCCNAVCGVCAKSAEECVAVPGRCEAVGIDPSFQRCSEMPATGATFTGIGTLPALLPRLRGRWLVCSREADTSNEEVIAGLDFTSDGRFFVLERVGKEFLRVGTPTSSGSLVVPNPGGMLSELDLVSDEGVVWTVLLFFSDEPKILWLRATPSASFLGARYMYDPTADVE